MSLIYLTFYNFLKNYRPIFQTDQPILDPLSYANEFLWSEPITPKIHHV